MSYVFLVRQFILLRQFCLTLFKRQFFLRFFIKKVSLPYKKECFRIFKHYLNKERPQFVDTLFIVRLRLNMSMRRAVIINYFLAQKVELKIYYYLLLKFCLGLTKSPWHNLSQKSTELTTKLMRTIVLIQNIDHSFIVVSRKYTNLNWQNNTFFFDKSVFS